MKCGIIVLTSSRLKSRLCEYEGIMLPALKRYYDKQKRDFRMSKPFFKDQVDAQSYCICIMGTAGLWHFNKFPCSRDGKLIDFNARNMDAQWRVNKAEILAISQHSRPLRLGRQQTLQLVSSAE
ncbi:hypothetical protein AKJ16_DCAP04921 [Drosera capensis]